MRAHEDPEHILIVDHPCFSDADRISNNCFMQFQEENALKCRPVRRLESSLRDKEQVSPRR